MDKSAIISACGQYRYVLVRSWEPGARAVFIMLNPSTADHAQDDPTIRKCLGFSRQWGCGSLAVVNLFGFRATQPRTMFTADDPIGPDNDRHIAEAIATAAGPVVCAWGAHGGHLDRNVDVLAQLLAVRAKVMALGLTKAGHPRHPLYAPYSAVPSPLEATRAT